MTFIFFSFSDTHQDILMPAASSNMIFWESPPNIKEKEATKYFPRRWTDVGTLRVMEEGFVGENVIN